MNDTPASGSRLDSWKAIAEYLQRDVATVRRWEKSLGLPVHRVGGSGRSVFTSTSEIDEWLHTARPALPNAAAGPPVPAAVMSARVPVWGWVLLMTAVLALAGIFIARPGTVSADDLRVELTTAGVVAQDSDGRERWYYRFPATHQTFVPLEAVQVVGGSSPGVYVATSHRSRQTEDRIEAGALTLLDLEGRVRRSFSFHDEVVFDGTRYGPPWAISGFAVNEADDAPARVAVTAHHYMWDPGIVTILDAEWRRQGTFVHAGWLEQVRWLGPDRLVVAGFSNAREGGTIALLDAARLDGQGPEPEESRHHCADCGDGRPLRMVVFPRSEVNLASASRFNRARVQTFAGGRLTAHTVEMPSPTGDAGALYELTTSLDLVTARFNERYWDMHRALELEGKITHARAECPDRDGPREIQIWDPSTGWRTLRTR